MKLNNQEFFFTFMTATFVTVGAGFDLNTRLRLLPRKLGSIFWPCFKM